MKTPLHKLGIFCAFVATCFAYKKIFIFDKGDGDSFYLYAQGNLTASQAQAQCAADGRNLGTLRTRALYDAFKAATLNFNEPSNCGYAKLAMKTSQPTEASPALESFFWPKHPDNETGKDVLFEWPAFNLSQLKTSPKGPYVIWRFGDRLLSRAKNFWTNACFFCEGPAAISKLSCWN